MLYFDNAATTPIDHRVVDEMLPYLTTNYGNPSSLHSFGFEANEVLNRSRKIIAQSINAQLNEIAFTGSGTEANNLALKGVVYANRHRGNHIIVSTIEHDSILNTCKWLERQAIKITYLPVDSTGIVDIEQLNDSITNDTILVSIMSANNEIGTIQPIEKIGKLCRERGVYFHSDASQAYGKIKLDFSTADLVTLSSHKIYGPKGVGAIFIRQGVRLEPLLHGGGQEFGLRSSTENIAGIVGFAKAIALCGCEIETEISRISSLRDRVIAEIINNISVAYLNGHATQRLPGNINIGFAGLEGDAIRLLVELDKAGIAISSGSACSSNEYNAPSHVLQAIGRNPVEARGALRITLGRFNTAEQVDKLISVFFKVFNKLKSVSTIEVS